MKTKLKWIAGFIFFMIAFSCLVEGGAGILAAIYLIIGGLICIPISLIYFENKLNIELKSVTKYLLVFFCLLLGRILLPDVHIENKIIIIILIATVILGGIYWNVNIKNIFFLLKTTEKAHFINPKSQTIIRDFSLSTNNTITSNKPKRSISLKEKEFVFNPGAPFELTLLNADEEVFLKIRKILSDLTLNEYNKVPQIVGLFAEYNLKVKEVEDYKKKYRKVYFDKIEELKNNSNEWISAGEKDKEDMLVDFRQIAMNEIYEKTKFDDYILFEYEPNNIKIDDEIIKEYGFENVETYLRFSDNLNKVRVLSNGNYNRPRFEKLAEVGLACRGNAIPLPEILSTLTLKELNELAKNPAIEYKRKNLALDYLLNLPDINEMIGSKISLRELFKLNPIPEKYSSLNLKEISENLNYINIVVSLLIDTYRNSCFTIETLLDKEDVKGYTVSNYDQEKFMCPCAKKLINKNYPKSRPPKIPYHIGCSCSLEKNYDSD